MVLDTASMPLAEEAAVLPLEILPSGVSPQLLEANRRLLALRQQIQADRAASSDENLPVGKHCRIPREIRRQNAEMAVVSIYRKVNSRKPEPAFSGENHLDVDAPLSAYTMTAVATNQSTVGKVLANLPPHLGWWSERLADIGRGADSSTHSPLTTVPQASEDPSWSSLSTFNSQLSITLCWGLAYAILREGVAPVARIWLLLRHLDETGKGWIGIEAARQALTEKESPLKVCEWRQLRNLLTQGQGVFWERDKTRIWLRSTAKVAFALGVEGMGQAVLLPVAVLNGRLADFKAHLYATFHTCRQKEGRKAMPIARETLASLSGVRPSSQRTYENKSGIRKSPNFTTGVREGNREMVEEMTWQKGMATFSFRDMKGKQGPTQGQYLAWQMPNSYQSQQTPKGKQRRHNRRLADLRKKKGVGNSQKQIVKRYFPDGAQAAKAYNRNSQQERYWPSPTGQRAGDGIWYVLVTQTRQ